MYKLATFLAAVATTTQALSLKNKAAAHTDIAAEIAEAQIHANVLAEVEDARPYCDDLEKGSEEHMEKCKAFFAILFPEDSDAARVALIDCLSSEPIAYNLCKE